jgi:hypothetical protein
MSFSKLSERSELTKVYDELNDLSLYGFLASALHQLPFHTDDRTCVILN